jgi:uncharacterized membrane protein YidH (DUF202 family)
MSTTPLRPLPSAGQTKAQPSEDAAKHHHVASVRGAIAWSSLLFALLQSVCTFFAAANGLRFAVGLGSLVLSAGAGAMVDRLHADALRVPMIGIALVGSIVNLAVLGQIRWLRGRPASRWRQQLPTPGKLRMERLQVVLSVATLALVAVEELFHYHYLGHL